MYVIFRTVAVCLCFIGIYGLLKLATSCVSVKAMIAVRLLLAGQGLGSFSIINELEMNVLVF